MNLSDELNALIKAGVPLAQLVTYEEERVIRALQELQGEARRYGIALWDMADGFTEHRPGSRPMVLDGVPPTPEAALAFIAQKAPHEQIFLLRDFHQAWRAKPAYVTRKLRNMARSLRERKQFLFCITPEHGLPIELKDDMVTLAVPYPNETDLRQLFEQVKRDRSPDTTLRPEVKNQLIASALGLTTSQARVAFSRVPARYERFDERGIGLVTSAKREIIRESGALEYFPADEGDYRVGGLDLLKGYLEKRGRVYSEEARYAGLPYPRGILLAGIPGTGKSLSVKMLSGLWKMPLLRLDIGSLFGSLQGESESNMRRAVALADAVSPCLLWIDEIEKGFAGTGVHNINAGAATRVFGSFLTWMQEHRTPVFVVATANDITGLPVELLGRFNRSFFLGMPNNVERRQILIIHLNKAQVDYPETNLRIDLDALVERSRGYVGREIERAVQEAQFTAFADGNRPIEQPDLLAAFDDIVPISRSHAEPIAILERWLQEGRIYPASSPEPPAPRGGRQLQLG